MEKTVKALFDPAGIERELHILERSQSQAETRTSLFNLVVVGTGEGVAETEERLLGRLLGRRAARVIHITLDTPGPTEVFVNARCLPDREDKGVCFQEIHISAGEDGAGTAPGSWSAFLIRDIPVHVLWMTGLAGRRQVLRHTREQADKFIIDGACQVRPGGLSFDDYLMAVKIELLGQGVPTADLAWERLAPLRGLTAQAFDFPGPLAALPEVEEILLSGAGETELRLYGLWVASRLGWTRAGEAFAAPGGRLVPLTIRPAGAPGAAVNGAPPTGGGGEPPGDGTPRGGKPASPPAAGEGCRVLFRFSRGPDLELCLPPWGVATAVWGGDELLSKAISFPSDGDILLAQVDMPGYDGLYEGALELV